MHSADRGVIPRERAEQKAPFVGPAILTYRRADLGVRVKLSIPSTERTVDGVDCYGIKWPLDLLHGATLTVRRTT